MIPASARTSGSLKKNPGADGAGVSICGTAFQPERIFHPERTVRIQEGGVNRAA